MSHAPQAALVDRPVTAARSAPARAESPSAERYAPVVRIAVLVRSKFEPDWPETSLESNYAGVTRVNSFIRTGFVSAGSRATGRLLRAASPCRRAVGVPNGRRSRCRPSVPTTVAGRDA